MDLLILFIFQTVACLFGAETFPVDSGIGPEALPMAYRVCFLIAVLSVGLVFAFVQEPDGQSIFFNVILIFQVGDVIGNLIEYSSGTATVSSRPKQVMFVVAAVIFLFAYFRPRPLL